jgi:hypothetical protein
MTPVDLTSQSYPIMSYSNNVSTGQVSTQNFPQTAVNISSSLPPYMTTTSEIIMYEIPGYDVIYIPKPYPNSNINLNMQQQGVDFLNSSPLEQQSHVSSMGGISVGGNAINTYDNQTMIVTDNLPQNQQQF